MKCFFGSIDLSMDNGKLKEQANEFSGCHCYLDFHSFAGQSELSADNAVVSSMVKAKSFVKVETCQLCNTASTRVVSKVDVGILCEPCNGKGWLVCDYCNGQKNNVKAPNNRIYRRCPSCRAVGYVVCSKCKVFKCITFPNYNDGEELFL